MTARAEYLRGIMDAVTDPNTHTVTVMSSAQIGKTEILLNVIGYYIAQDPAPMLLVQPTLEISEAFSKDRLAPMLRDTPALRDRVADARARNSGNTTKQKTFPGGHITMGGANSPSSLASRPVRIVLCDEVDRYPASAGTEGDPVSLAEKRATTFWNRKRVRTSTPTIRGQSRIETSLEQGDGRRYHVPCPECGTPHVLMWEHMHWETDPENTAQAVRAWMSCPACGAEIREEHRPRMMAQGKWVADRVFSGHASFHIWEAYSGWVRWLDTVNAFLLAKGSKETLKAFVNTALGETWEERDGEAMTDADALRTRREPYIRDHDSALPDGVSVVCMLVDVQDDRLQIEFKGFGADEESWGIEYVTLVGDPDSADLWAKLDNQLARTFRRVDGAMLGVTYAGIDSGGHYTSKVYAWVRKHRGRAYAFKGKGGQGLPLVAMGAKVKGQFIRLWIVGTDTAKDAIHMSRLKLSVPGPRYMHFPSAYPDSYFDELCAETVETHYRAGRPTRSWVCPKGKRNEALDLNVYALALVALVKPDFATLSARLRATVEPETEKPKPALAGPARRKSSFWD